MSDEQVLPFPGPPRVPPMLVAAVEAVLFATGLPIKLEQIASSLPEAHPDDIEAALAVLKVRCDSEERGLEVVETVGGWQLRTDARFADIVQRAVRTKPSRLSRAALEVLSITAWEQPVTKAEIDRVRGVDSGGALRGLMERGLVRVSGRRDEPGRPLEYRTTRAFLQVFGIPDLKSLPTLADAAELPPADDD